MTTRLGLMMMVDAVSTTTTYWMREGSEKVVLCASGKASSGVEDRKARTLEQKAVAVAEALGMRPRFGGSMAKSDGKGGVTVTAMAEIPWTPRVSAELQKMGLVEVR